MKTAQTTIVDSLVPKSLVPTLRVGANGPRSHAHAWERTTATLCVEVSAATGSMPGHRRRAAASCVPTQSVGTRVMRPGFATALLAGLLIVTTSASGQDVKKAPPEDPAHVKLRELRDRLLAAFNKRDIDTMLKDVHENVVITWQNGEVSRGHKGVKDFYDKMMTGPQRIVQDANVSHAEADDLTMLSADGKYGLAWGKIDEHFTLTDGLDFDLANRWTASLVKDGDEWKVLGLHVSANVFDNPVQNIAVKKVATYAGIGAGVVGLLIGGLFAAFLMRRRPA